MNDYTNKQVELTNNTNKVSSNYFNDTGRGTNGEVNNAPGSYINFSGNNPNNADNLRRNNIFSTNSGAYNPVNDQGTYSNNQYTSYPSASQDLNKYDGINNEIKHFLTLADKKPQHQESQTINTLDDLINVLNRLEKTYSNIHTYLLTDNKENLKNELLNSDIKMSIMCESLIRVLRDVSLERNNLLKVEEDMNNKLKDKTDQLNRAASRISQFEHEIEFNKRGIEELGRVIKDQKHKMYEYKEKAELEKRNTDSLKAINEELESLRKKATEKVNITEKEGKELRKEISDKDSHIKKLKNQLTEKDRANEEIGKRMISLESTICAIKKQLENKENALAVCNSELSNLINKIKDVEAQNEDYKEKASYYERLYEATNNQNEYLNKQLSKMINLENIDKVQNLNLEENPAESSVVSAPETKAMKRKAKKYKREYKKAMDELYSSKKNLGLTLKKYKDDIDRLNEEKKKALLGNNKITETLMNRIEALMGKNREYQEQIIELKGRPRLGEDGFMVGGFKNLVKDEELSKARSRRIAGINNEREHKFNDMKSNSNFYVNKRVDALKPRNVDGQQRYNINAEKLDDEFNIRRDGYNSGKTNLANDDMYGINRSKRLGINVTDDKNNIQKTNVYDNTGNIVNRFDDMRNLSYKKLYDINEYDVNQQNDSFKTITDGEVTKEENVPYIVDDEFYLQNQRIAKEIKNLNIDFLGGNKQKTENSENKNDIAQDHKMLFGDNKEADNHAIKKPVGFVDKQPIDSVHQQPNDPTEHFNDANTFEFMQNEDVGSKHQGEIAEIDSKNKNTNSTGSVKTTSTLKDMLKRTEMLQKKFDTLEDQLNVIKKSDESEPKKIHDQIKAYTDYYYSDYLLDLSNESDFM